ncbi:MAG: transcriptional repressor [Oscillospiraceae bacterium]|nr:transcriptional repressor [Oscillospiraceae bacterium]
MEATSKNFRKRNAVLAYLQGKVTHPSAETIYTDLKQEIPDLSMATVYRNLTKFRQEGLVQCVATVKGIERYDANTHPHVHFICRHCDAVIDLHEMQIPPALQSQAASLVGGNVDSCNLSFTGLCRECLAKERTHTA